MARLAKEIEEYMESEGFKLIRRSKHNVWSDGYSTVVTGITVSDRRAFDNIKSDVRRSKRRTSDETAG